MSLINKIDQLIEYNRRSGYMQALQDIKNHLTSESQTLEKLYDKNKMSVEDLHTAKIKLEIYFELLRFIIKLVEVKETNLN